MAREAVLRALWTTVADSSPELVDWCLSPGSGVRTDAETALLSKLMDRVH